MSKVPPRTSRLLVVLAIGFGSQVGCGGGGSAKQKYPDAATFDSGGATGGAAGASVTGTGGAGTGLVGGGGAGGSGVPAPPPAAGSTLLIGGTAILIGPGASCTQPPTVAGAAAPDRWCGIFMPGATNTQVALSVFNLTKALAGTAISCTAGDANCLSLSANIDTTNPDATYGFDGQTLLYYDAASVYAWRPGWTAGRTLLAHSATQSVSCSSNDSGAPTAICTSTNTTTMVATAYAGTIDTQAGPALPMLESLGTTSSGISFSPDGQSAVWSVPVSATDPAETLKTQKIGDATTRKMVAMSVTGWSISRDGTRFFWMSAPATDANGFTTGTLQTAPYPTGTTPQTLLANVWDYSSFGTKGLFTLTAPTALSAATFGADLSSISDIDNPATTIKVLEAKDVIGMVDINDSGTVLYSTMFDQPDPTVNNFLVDLKVTNADGTGKCAVAATPSADRSASLGLSGSAVEWVQVTLNAAAAVTAINGQVTPIAECAPHTFSKSPASYSDVKTGLIFQENLDTTTFTADLQYSLFSAANTPNPPMQVQLGADTVVVPLFPDIAKVLFSISGRTTGDGIYVSPMLTGAPTADFLPTPRGLKLAPADLVAMQARSTGYTLSDYRAGLAARVLRSPLSKGTVRARPSASHAPVATLLIAHLWSTASPR